MSYIFKLTGAALSVARGGTGLATLTANNVILGNGTSAPNFVAPGSSGNLLTSNGTTWVSSAPAPGGITTLNTLTATTQIFATGTSGSDFNIDSTTATHTFNFPNASASNRGLLTSTDWSTFNGKQAAGSYITALTGDVTASGPGSASASISASTVTGKLITGFSSGAGTVSSSDTILQAINKLDGNTNAKVGGSGTSGKLTKWNGSGTITSSVWAEDSNGAVSGTLAGGTAATLILSNGTASAPIYQFKDNSTLVEELQDGGFWRLTPATTPGDGLGFEYTSGSWSSAAGEYYGKTILIAPATSSNSQLLRGINLNIQNNTVTNSVAYLRGLHLTITTIVNTPFAAQTGTGTFGARINVQAANTTSGTGASGLLIFGGAGNVNFGSIAAMAAGAGTSPVTTGYHAGINYTGADKVNGFSVKLGTTTNDALMSPSPVVNALYWGDNGASGYDLLNLYNNGSSSFQVTSAGQIKINTAGSGVSIKEGSNAKMGIATLSGGTVVVSTTAVTANSRIFLEINGGTLTNVGAVYVSARAAGTSFTISSLNVLDASDVAWMLVEPA